MVRGATQRLVKQELNGQPNDALEATLDGILEELATGEGESGLVRLEDDVFQQLIAQMQRQWAEIKAEIPAVRGGADGTGLYRLSEEYFVLADQAVCAAENYSEAQVRRAEQGLVILSGVFLLLAGLLAWYGAVQARRQRALAEAEDANRLRREHLMQMSADLRAPMDEISEVMYVADPESYELLYINEQGRRSFGITDLEGKSATSSCRERTPLRVLHYPASGTGRKLHLGVHKPPHPAALSAEGSAPAVGGKARPNGDRV